MATQLKGKIGDVTPEEFASNLKTIQEQGAGDYTYAKDPSSRITITSDQLKPIEPTNLPSKPKIDTSNIQGNISDFSSKNTADQAIANLKAESTKNATDISNLIKDIGITSAKEGDFIKQEGGYEAKKQYDEYASQLEQEQLRSRREQERLRQFPGGMSTGALNDELDRLERQSLSKQADIAILGNAAAKRYDTALTIAKNKVDLLLAPKKAELEGLKYIYDNNKSFQTAEFSSLLSAKQREIDNEQKTRETIENIKIESVKNGFKNPLAFENVKTVNEALSLAGQYLVSPKEKYELEKLRIDNEKNNLELINAKSTLNGTTGDPILDVITASSKYGDKRLTDSQLEKIQKAQQALGSMETLQSLLSSGKDGLNLNTGFLTGRARTLISQLGGDANAKAINATIQGLVPTVARGIFGEVGVLTDADIENYRKTIPNLNSTKEQNTLISAIMYDVLSRSLASTLTTNASNQTNVSGFANTYKDINTRITNLKSTLGVTESNIDPVNESKMDVWWNNQNNNITNSLNRFLN